MPSTSLALSSLRTRVPSGQSTFPPCGGLVGLAVTDGSTDALGLGLTDTDGLTLGLEVGLTLGLAVGLTDGLEVGLVLGLGLVVWLGSTDALGDGLAGGVVGGT